MSDRLRARVEHRGARRPKAPEHKPLDSSSVNATGGAATLLALQRTVGNAAVSALLRNSDVPTAARSGQATVNRAPAIQRLMSFRDFQKATQQLERRKRSGIRGVFGAKKTRTNENLKKLVEEPYQRRGRTDINEMYEAYEEHPSLASLIALYDRITYWQTLHADDPWLGEVQFALDAVKEQIQAEVKAETAKQAGGKDGLPMDDLLDKKGTAGKPAAMEPFLKEVGVPQGYYDEHLAGHADYIAALQEFYNGLKDGHLYNASRAYRKVSHLEGMYLLKPLFLTRFPNQAHLGGLAGTEADPGENHGLTPEEMDAIKTYSGGSYLSMNSQLREHDMRPSKAPRIGRARMTEDDKKAAKRDSDRRSMMELAVSGMNKLPKYQGVAYRVSVKVPPGYFAAVRAGGMMSDLAFSSASPSMTGVGEFASTQFGTKSIYYIIHTKTAVNIVALALGAAEAEVLFRPGTRFKVQTVWQHVNGKVPSQAPVEAQMVLHAMGPFKDEQGRTEAEWTEKKRQMLILGSDAEKANWEKSTYGDSGVNPVKVVELVEA